MKVKEIKVKLKKETEAFFRKEWKKSDIEKGFEWNKYAGPIVAEDNKKNYIGFAQFKIIRRTSELK